MMPVNFSPQEFYTQQGQISDPGPLADRLDELPDQLPDLVKVIQGVMLHLHWASRQGITLNRVCKEEANLRLIKDRLKQVERLSRTLLIKARPLTRKTVGTCRDFALMLTSILRHKHVPARARAGFGTYFTPDRFEDHWVCEHWHEEQKRWVMVDPQLDDMMMNALAIDFDPLDMPQGKFISGPPAWLLCRSKEADPDRFGIFKMKGLGFIKGNLIRDFLALNKIEILPWDNFMMIRKPLSAMNITEQEFLDRLARISSAEDRDFVMLRAAFTAHQHRLLPDYFIQ